ncbi:MAG: glycogen/starch/alpha-glucan family phosphorylase, partial [Clostridia bacterium]|nr:glycogen/starch/alpha-glucan family phosphorylase [Clostridia bacterium]
MELKDKQQLQKLIENKATVNFGKSLKEANSNQFYKCVSMAVRDLLTEQRYEFKKQVRKQNSKQIYYMSMEFLLGRSLKNHLFNMGITDIVDEIATSYGWKMDDIYACEPDAGLGNGGLGRLAAAYMESLTNMNYAANGFSIKYDYGIFKQKIADGWQVELPDQWLDDGAVWLTPRKEDTFTVRFGGRINQRWEGDRLFIDYEDCDVVEATPYDMNISGYNSFAVNKLRLWTASAPKVFDMQLFSAGQYVKSTEAQSLAESICRVLYPADHHVEGKMLRLKQQYFFVSASIQSILKTHIAQYGTLDNLGDKVAIHINDTHPTLCIPELMRLLLDEYGYDWDKAWGIVTKTISYTNHTVMAEALEKWPANLFERLLPRIYQIVCEINSRFCNDLWNFYPNDWNKVSYNAILSHNQIKMANLCLAASHTINGVSELHSDILKRDVFDDYYRMYPDKFTNVTNGITYRRWLCQANPRLTGFVRDLIGDGFLKDANELKKLERYKGKQDVLAQINAIKLANKQDLAAYIAKETGEKIDPNSIFDVQVKRLHEYKRQLLNVLHIMHTYYSLKDNPSLDITPRTYIFGAKAAPSYYMAKQIIRLIC